MLVAQLLGQLALLTLELRELGLLLLDVGVRQHGGEGIEPTALFAERLELAVERLLLKTFGLRLRHRAIEIGQLLDDDVLPVLERDRVVLLAITLQRSFGRFNLAALLRQPIAEPVAGFLRSHELVLEILIDVVLRDRVDDPRREIRVGELVLHVHEPAVSNRRHGQIVEEPIDRP